MPRDARSDAIIVERTRKYFSVDYLPTVGGFEEVVYVISEKAFYVYSSGEWVQVGGSSGGGISGFDTGDLSEGTNLYYTNSRVDTRIANAIGVSIVGLGVVNTFTHGQSIVAASGEVGLNIQAASNANALNIKNSAGITTLSVDKDGYAINVERTFLLGISTPLTTGVNKTNQVTMTRSGKFLKAFINAKTAPTGADLIIDINRNGTTIWSTQANRLKLVDGASTGVQTSFDTVNFIEGDVISIDVDQVGSTVAGQDITVQLLTLCKNGAV